MKEKALELGLKAVLESPVGSVYSIVWPDIKAEHVRTRPVHKNNFTVENGLFDRFLRVVDFITVLDIAVQEVRDEERIGTHVQFKIEDYTGKDRLIQALDTFGSVACRLPDNDQGNQLLAAWFSTQCSDGQYYAKWISNVGHTVFHEHPLNLAQMDRTRSVVWESVETLVYYQDMCGEVCYPSSVRIPLQRADGCPFYDIALLAVVYGAYEERTAEFHFVFKMDKDSPWSILSNTKEGPDTVRNQVLKYSYRKWVCENTRRPFTHTAEWPHLP